MPIEFGQDLSLIKTELEHGYQLLENAFREQLIFIASHNDNLHMSDPRLAAVKLLALYQGILVLVRCRYKPKIIKSMINDEFENLFGGNING